MTERETSAITREELEAAREAVRGLLHCTTLERSDIFSRRCGCEIFLKLENRQKTGSFKVRGALNRILHLDAEARRRGVVTASAGNHAQGLAWAARHAGVPCTVVMPVMASFSKMSATADYGARVLRAGLDYAEAFERALVVSREEGATFIPAFDDREIIVGQGTVGLEILEQCPQADTIVVPVGGGGLLAGVVSAVRATGSKARVIGVQAAGASSLGPSLRVGRRIQLDAVDTIADGLATRAIGALPFALVQEHLHAAVEVSDEETAEAVLLLLERTKTVVEGGGAVGLAACLNGHLPDDAAHVVVILSGGNIDLNLLDRILNLGLLRQGRRFRFTTHLADRPGELQRLVATIAAGQANIHQVAHLRSQPDLPLTQAAVTLELETRDPAHIAEIAAALTAAGFAVLPP